MLLLIPLALAPSLVTALVLGDVCTNNANQTQTGTCDPTTLGTVSCRTNCFNSNTPTCTNICGYDTCFQPGYIPGGTNWGTCVAATNVTFSGACAANSNCQNYTPTNHIDCNNNQCCCLSPYVENIQTNLCEEPIDVPPTDGCVQTSNCADVPFGTKYCDAGTCNFTCTGNYVKSPDGKSCVEPSGLSYGQPCVSNGNCNVTNGSGLCAALPGGNTTVCSIQNCTGIYVLAADKKSCVEPSNVAPLQPCMSNGNCAPISNGTTFCEYGTCAVQYCDSGYSKSIDSASCVEQKNVTLGKPCAYTSSCFKNMNGTTTCSLDQSKGYNVCQYSSCDNGYTIGNNNTTCTLSTNVGIGNPCSTTSSCASGTNGIISCTQPQTSSQTQQLPTLCLYTSCSPNFSLRQDQTACTPNSGLPDANKNLGTQIASLQGTKVSAETGLFLSRDFTKFVPENYIYDPAGLAFYQVDVSVAGGSNYSFYATPLVASQNGLDGAMVAISSSVYDFTTVLAPINGGSVASSIQSKLSNGFVELFYTASSTIQAVWVTITLAADESSVMVQVNSGKQVLFLNNIQLSKKLVLARAPGATFTVASGSAALSPIVHLGGGDGKVVTLTDNQYANNASIILQQLPTCAASCLSKIPGLQQFQNTPSTSTLTSTCLNITPQSLSAYTTCISTSNCVTQDLPPAKSFPTQFGPLCKVYTQPSPTITFSQNKIITNFTLPESLTILPTKYDISIVDSKNRTIAGTKFTDFSQRRRDITSFTTDFTFPDCNPVTPYVKYAYTGQCDSALVEDCPDFTKGHLKSNEIDPTKTVGSGYYGGKCDSSTGVLVSVAPPSDAMGISSGVTSVGSDVVLTLSGSKLTSVPKFVTKVEIWSASANLGVDAGEDGNCADASKAWCPARVGGIDFSCFTVFQSGVDTVVTLATNVGNKVSGCGSARELAFVVPGNSFYRFKVHFDANPTGTRGSNFVGRDGGSTVGDVYVLGQVAAPSLPPAPVTTPVSVPATTPVADVLQQTTAAVLIPVVDVASTAVVTPNVAVAVPVATAAGIVPGPTITAKSGSTKAALASFTTFLLFSFYF